MTYKTASKQLPLFGNAGTFRNPFEKLLLHNSAVISGKGNEICAARHMMVKFYLCKSQFAQAITLIFISRKIKVIRRYHA